MAPGLKRLYARLKESVLREVLAIKGLMRLLMKRRNTGDAWTREEKAEIKGRLKALSRTIPFLLIFCLPGGSLLLPVLASVLDRRKLHRPLSEGDLSTLGQIRRWGQFWKSET
ncbi:MAG TPA: hypothetical protein VGA73_14205 [Candidatus Binatia bacterium]